MDQKEKYQLEFEIKSSPKILFNYLSTASGLEEWFADKVNIEKSGQFSFFWDGEARKAKIISKKDNQLVRYQWIDEKDDSYFEFEIVKDDITSDVALLVTDFTTREDKIQNEQLWHSQIVELKQIIGS
jgi:uncharacterized protein YndB with AHSA1/START domain